jgi:hypothetical protein
MQTTQEQYVARIENQHLFPKEKLRNNMNITILTPLKFNWSVSEHSRQELTFIPLKLTNFMELCPA